MEYTDHRLYRGVDFDLSLMFACIRKYHFSVQLLNCFGKYIDK